MKYLKIWSKDAEWNSCCVEKKQKKKEKQKEEKKENID